MLTLASDNYIVCQEKPTPSSSIQCEGHGTISHIWWGGFDNLRQEKDVTSITADGTELNTYHGKLDT